MVVRDISGIFFGNIPNNSQEIKENMCIKNFFRNFWRFKTN